MGRAASSRGPSMAATVSSVKPDATVRAAFGAGGVGPAGFVEAVVPLHLAGSGAASSMGLPQVSPIDASVLVALSTERVLPQAAMPAEEATQRHTMQPRAARMFSFPSESVLGDALCASDHTPFSALSIRPGSVLKSRRVLRAPVR